MFAATVRFSLAYTIIEQNLTHSDKKLIIAFEASLTFFK